MMIVIQYVELAMFVLLAVHGGKGDGDRHLRIKKIISDLYYFYKSLSLSLSFLHYPSSHFISSPSLFSLSVHCGKGDCDRHLGTKKICSGRKTFLLGYTNLNRENFIVHLGRI